MGSEVDECDDDAGEDNGDEKEAVEEAAKDTCERGSIFDLELACGSPEADVGEHDSADETDGREEMPVAFCRRSRLGVGLKEHGIHDRALHRPSQWNGNQHLQWRRSPQWLIGLTGVVLKRNLCGGFGTDAYGRDYRPSFGARASGMTWNVVR